VIKLVTVSFPNDIEIRKKIKFLERKAGFLLEKMFSDGRYDYVVDERELNNAQKGQHHPLGLKDFSDDVLFMAEHSGYKMRPNDGFVLTSKELRIRGEAYLRAKKTYDVCKD
jgi:hypothetical protein